MMGYHPGDYSFPRDDRERFEICTGAILTQNTAWPNVEKAISGLLAADAMSPEAILALPEEQLCAAIRPAGYFNQKVRKLRAFSVFFSSLRARVPERHELLALWGVGPETADSMLLYAFRVPSFVVDAYTRRIFSGLGLVERDAPHEQVKAFFEAGLPRDLVVYQEFHALIVEHAKRRDPRGGRPACRLRACTRSNQ